MPSYDDEIARFVMSRNKLVHEGHFYCERATDQERARVTPLSTVYSEWFWLLHFVDRLFLRAIGYEGKYLTRLRLRPTRCRQDQPLAFESKGSG
jgi:hypothetical protein